MPTNKTHTIETVQAPEVTVRVGAASDAGALRRLAIIDSAAPLGGPVFLAEVEGRIVAAIALTGGRAIADPFMRTAAIVEMLELRAAQIRSTSLERRSPRRVREAAPRAA